jgi:diguanylate cyclase (GGDEF)-like protein
MRHTLRRGDLAARIGGDEFALLLPSTEADFVPMLLNRLQAGVARNTAEASVGFSTGVASCPADAEEVDALRRLADERLYTAKAKSRIR